MHLWSLHQQLLNTFPTKMRLNGRDCAKSKARLVMNAVRDHPTNGWLMCCALQALHTSTISCRAWTKEELHFLAL